MEPNYFSVAIDGPAGAGKSTIARQAAAQLGFVYVDTGAIYRTVAFGVCRAGISPEDAEGVSSLLQNFRVELIWPEDGLQHMLLNGEDVTGEIRSPEVSDAASRISAIPAVRSLLLETQRHVARTHRVIMDGRDIGTVVLPDADVKIFLSASAEVRAKRRWLELQARNLPDTYESVLRDMEERDWRDSHRAVAPLRQAEDAVLVDTSQLTLEESIQAVIEIIEERASA